MNLDADKLTFTFESKELADAAAAKLIGKFRMFERKVRKALPEYKGHRSKNFTLYVKPATFAEQCAIKAFLKGIV